MDSKTILSKKKNQEKTIKKEKKPSYRVKRATWFEKDEYEKTLKLFQEHYPKDFPKKKVVDTIPTLSILKAIKKEKKIKITDLLLSRFFHQYITKQQNKSFSNKKYEIFLNLIETHYPKDFSKDYNVTPKNSIFKRIKKENKISLSKLGLCRFVNQYLKKQKAYFNYRDKKDKEILIMLQTIYPKAFPKNERKLLKLGIFEDIKTEGKIPVTDNDLKSFLDDYTKSKGYLECYFTNPVRHDLKGNIVEPTNPKERFFAKKTLNRIQKK